MTLGQFLGPGLKRLHSFHSKASSGALGLHTQGPSWGLPSRQDDHEWGHLDSLAPAQMLTEPHRAAWSAWKATPQPRGPQFLLLPIPDLQLWHLIKCCFKSLSFGVITYTALNCKTSPSTKPQHLFTCLTRPVFSQRIHCGTACSPAHKRSPLVHTLPVLQSFWRVRCLACCLPFTTGLQNCLFDCRTTRSYAFLFKFCYLPKMIEGSYTFK